jgi:hypothetical protein
MNLYHLYEELKSLYVDYGFHFKLEEVIIMVSKTELSYEEIRDAYEDFVAALPNLQPGDIWGKSGD